MVSGKTQKKPPRSLLRSCASIVASYVIKIKNNWNFDLKIQVITRIAQMMSEETTKECNGIDLSCKKTLIHGETKSQGDDDGDEDNIVLLAGAIEEKIQS